MSQTSQPMARPAGPRGLGGGVGGGGGPLLISARNRNRTSASIMTMSQKGSQNR